MNCPDVYLTKFSIIVVIYGIAGRLNYTQFIRLAFEAIFLSQSNIQTDFLAFFYKIYKKLTNQNTKVLVIRVPCWLLGFFNVTLFYLNNSWAFVSPSMGIHNQLAFRNNHF